jgi:hypothetical protein
MPRSAQGVFALAASRNGTIAVLTIVGLLGASVLAAQVTGGQAPPEARPAAPPQDIDVPSPLLIKVSLVPKAGGRSVVDLPMDAVKTFKETRQYVCDKARVEVVSVVKHTKHSGLGMGTYHSGKDRALLVIAAQLTTEWFAQRVDVTLSLYDGDKQIKSETWKSLRIGRDGIGVMGSSSSKTQELTIDLTDKALAAVFEEGHEPTVRVLMAINDN